NDLARLSQQMSLYFFVGVVNLGVNTLGMYILVDYFNIYYILAQVIMGGLIAISSFIIYRFFIFKKGKMPIASSGKKNILIATGIYLPETGGPAIYSNTLYQELPKHGYKVKIVSYSDGPDEIINNDIYKIKRRKNKLLRYFAYFRKVYKLIPWADIIYIQGPVSEGVPASFACKLRGREYILKIVGDYAWEQGKQRYGVKELVDEFQEKKIQPTSRKNAQFTKKSS
ncbi:MAG: GtrA family protein, partial [Patescibacteria group bacterium]